MHSTNTTCMPATPPNRMVARLLVLPTLQLFTNSCRADPRKSKSRLLEGYCRSCGNSEQFEGVAIHVPNAPLLSSLWPSSHVAKEKGPETAGARVTRGGRQTRCNGLPLPDGCRTEPTPGPSWQGNGPPGATGQGYAPPLALSGMPRGC